MLDRKKARQDEELKPNQELKQDDGKIQLGLVYRSMPQVFNAIAKVLMFGLKKGYKKDSWKQVDPERYWHALYRHLDAHNRGEYIASDSQLPHLHHALCNLLFLVYLNLVKENND